MKNEFNTLTKARAEIQRLTAELAKKGETGKPLADARPLPAKSAPVSPTAPELTEVTEESLALTVRNSTDWRARNAAMRALDGLQRARAIAAVSNKRRR
jgi:hypothetical protein